MSTTNTDDPAVPIVATILNDFQRNYTFPVSTTSFDTDVLDMSNRIVQAVRRVIQTDVRTIIASELDDFADIHSHTRWDTLQRAAQFIRTGE